MHAHLRPTHARVSSVEVVMRGAGGCQTIFPSSRYGAKSRSRRAPDISAATNHPALEGRQPCWRRHGEEPPVPSGRRGTSSRGRHAFNCPKLGHLSASATPHQADSCPDTPALGFSNTSSRAARDPACKNITHATETTQVPYPSRTRLFT